MCRATEFRAVARAVAREYKIQISALGMVKAKVTSRDFVLHTENRLNNSLAHSLLL